jgi:iron complex outermembrane receptor protein
MTTVDASLYYRFKMAGTSARVKFGVKNIEDTRAPTADRFFGFFADAHQDYGRNYNLSIKVDM